MCFRRVYILLAFTFLHAGCESAFEPLEKNDDLVFSMNGFLDLHADTQWVRVMPVGESLLPEDPAPNGTNVSILNLSTGKKTALRDSLFQFGSDTYVRNYWFDTGISQNERYEITAEAPGGAQSTVLVHTPSNLSVPDIEYSESTERVFISGTASDSIVVAQTRYWVQPLTGFGCGPERVINISHLEELFLGSENEFIINARNREEIVNELGVFNFRVNRREFVLVTAGPDWPAGAGLSEVERRTPGIISNVENGTGYVAGIARQTVELSERRPPCGG